MRLSAVRAVLAAALWLPVLPAAAVPAVAAATVDTAMEAEGRRSS